MSQQGVFMCCGGRLRAVREPPTLQLSVEAGTNTTESLSCELTLLFDVCVRVCVCVLGYSGGFWTI